MPRPFVFILVLAAVLGGCGSSSGNGAQIDSMMRSYTAAVLAGDGQGACSRMTPTLAKRLVSVEAARDPSLASDSCAEVIHAAIQTSLAAGGATVRKVFAIVKSNFKLQNLKVSGARATFDGVLNYHGASFKEPGVAQHVGSRWLLSCCVPGQSSP